MSLPRFLLRLSQPFQWSLLLPLTISGVRAADAPNRYLFLDPGIVAESHGTELKVNPPQRREIVIQPDRPWEKLMISFFLTVRDEGGKLRMWYICRDADNQPNLAYAESTDGVAWTKPNLGIVDYHGSRENNLVGLSDLGGVVFANPAMPPEERYQYVSTSHGTGSSKTAIYRFYSPDGLHWTRDAEPLFRAGSDTQNVTFWDEQLKTYVLYLRGWNPSPNRRKVVRATLPTLKEPAKVAPTGRGYGNFFFDELPTVLICDEQDPARTDIYNMSAQPYPVDPSWYVGFPTFLRRSAATDAPGYKGRHVGPAEVQFVGSRDSIKWDRYDRAAYAPPPLVKSDQRNMVFMGTGLVVRGDEIWQYGTEFHSQHGDVDARKARTDGFIARYVQRVDGFVALATGNTEGVARTVPVKVTGRQLRLNVDTGALGEMRVALLWADGKLIPGFEAENCVLLQGNATGAVVTWAGQPDVSALEGKDVALEFRGRRTKLYSFRFE
jgi:hypothetical protein